jgi:hypothetical protein
METLFAISSFLVLPFWGLMIFLPHWGVTRRLIGSPLSAALPAVFYTALVLPRLVDIWALVSLPDLAGIAGLLGSPAGATIAWFHFLAFDLFVGRWIYLDSRERDLRLAHSAGALSDAHAGAVRLPALSPDPSREGLSPARAGFTCYRSYQVRGYDNGCDIQSQTDEIFRLHA